MYGGARVSACTKCTIRYIVFHILIIEIILLQENAKLEYCEIGFLVCLWCD